jgi:hypothetical protein
MIVFEGKDAMIDLSHSKGADNGDVDEVERV